MKEKIRIGISEIRSARREYIREFWKVFSDVLGVEVVYSGIDLMAAYEKGKRFLNESNSYCFFRNLDIGQHIDLIEKNVDVLILLSLRETGKKVCNTECYVPEHLALAYPNMKIVDFVLHVDDPQKRYFEIAHLVQLFTNDKTKIKEIANAWPDKYIDKNRYLSRKHENDEINLLIVGDVYHFLNPRMDNSPYVELLSKKYNCKILTPPDIVDETEEASSMASRKIAENMPLLYNDLEHYWKREHLVKALLTGGKKVDGVLIVSDIWCEMFKEEIPIMINILEEQDIPYYNLVFNVDSLATIDTILESFVETLVYRRNNK